MSFFDEFNHIVPYFTKVTVGGNRQFKTDPTKKSSLNHKGKMVAFHRTPKTLEELAEHGLGGVIEEYLPAEQVSLPINIEVDSPNNILTKVEETSKFSRKTHTSHCIRIYLNNHQVGYTSIDINPTGDITNKYSSYESPYRTRELTHVIAKKYLDGKLSTSEHFTFEKYYEQGSKAIEISQRDGKITGAVVTEQERENKEGLKFPEIRASGNYINSRKLKSYVASCVTDETDMSKRGGTFIPWNCRTLESDLDGRGLLEYFKGDYIGNILKLTDNGYEACIVTTHQKSGQNYRLYTLIDLTGTSIAQGTGMEEFEGIDRDPNYFERLESADKTPTFVTRIGENGKEELVLYGGNAVSGECPEYNQFVSDFIAPFSEIHPIQISKFLNRENIRD